MTPNERRFDSLRALTARFRPDCVIELVWQACLTYDVESARAQQFVQDQLHLPYLKITTDYSPSDSARITARVEATLEMVRARPQY
jgi:benzoyl-CoA reductase/2-hydroxyglutaryl-CoA dehydratase subunit BcrC/BadD/HgdB